MSSLYSAIESLEAETVYILGRNDYAHISKKSKKVRILGTAHCFSVFVYLYNNSAVSHGVADFLLTEKQ